MKQHVLIIICVLCCINSLAVAAPVPPGDVYNRNGERVQVYAESHALIMGISDYRYWDRLDGVKKDVPIVRDVLEATRLSGTRYAESATQPYGTGECLQKFY